MEVSRVFSLQSASVQDVAKFRNLFINEYPSRQRDAVAKDFNAEVRELRQGSDESLISYYQRTVGLLHRMGSQDRFSEPPVELSPIEFFVLNFLMRAFICGMTDLELIQGVIPELANPKRSLRSVYEVADQLRCVRLVRVAFEEEHQQRLQLNFYRDLEYRNMPAHRINSLKASYSPNSAQRNQNPNQQVGKPRFNNQN